MPGCWPYRELDDALGLSVMAGEMLADARTGKNGRHALVGLLRQSVFGRLAGYEDVNDPERLRHAPAMRWIVGGKAAVGRAASPRQIGRCETQWLASRRAGDVAQPCGGKVERGLTVRERAHHTRAPPDLAQDALEGVVGANPPP